ncbi:unnamed protein product [Adineta ricciae]|uniref:Uncharacterized protein n=1 Tax=Adineta ricciae TaxID=249248 RepID=A0A815N3S5_ADIRI|nr:unnamed protein product [Adineta ricciae]CAF1653599.1 unnamed protein product [Adineta ricciae]
MWTTQFLYHFLWINIFVKSVTLTDLTAAKIRFLDRIDNSQMLSTLTVNVDGALNGYIRDHVSVKASTTRVIVWNELPTGYELEQHFRTSFKSITYDDTYQNFIKKDFDYTNQGTFQMGRTWERFVFARIPDGYLTLFLSYTVKEESCWLGIGCRTEVPSHIISEIKNFINDVSVRMFDKLLHPTKSIYSHGLHLVSDNSVIRFILVYHDGGNGYIEKPISSFNEGLKEQERINERKLSSCILMVEDGKKSLHSIRHPIVPGYIVPDFHAFYNTKSKRNQSASRVEL